MNLIPNQLRSALRRLSHAFNSHRGPYRRNARPIPDATIEKYHRAIWALDTMGPVAAPDRWALREIWTHATQVAANADGPDGGAIAADLIRTLNEQCERVLRECEKDPNRVLWEKQRDFLAGSLRRVRRACALQDVEHLHFYKKQAEVFNVDLKHPKFQVGYYLWQGIREELKAAVSYAIFSDKPLHPKVQRVVDSCRKIIRALEYADLEGFDFFDPRKSALDLSQEQQGELLWEAVRTEIARVTAAAEGAQA